MSFIAVQSRSLRIFREKDLKGSFDEGSRKLLYIQRIRQNLPYRLNIRNMRTFFFEDKINNIPPMARTDHAINFEKNSIISYKSIYYFSERKLIILK
jgi:hypothetical protein